MSGGLPQSSSGNSTAQPPPTAAQTPTFTDPVFARPLFDTPKTDLGCTSSTPATTPGPGWTPRFAEEFSVFHSTPANLRDSQSLFPDFGPPCSPSAPQPTTAASHGKRPLSVGSFTADIPGVHDHNLPTAYSLSPSSSPASLFADSASPTTTHDRDDNISCHNDPGEEEAHQTDSRANRRAVARSKKARNSTKSKPAVAAAEVRVQTATPPPSAQKKGGRRKLAPGPRRKASIMQSDQGYGPQHQPPPHSDFMTTPQQPHMATFAASPGDLFGYPMSAPPTASAFVDARAFWAGADQHMGTMDVDFASAESRIFQTSTPVHQQLDHMDWAQASQANQSYMLASTGPASGPAGAMQQQQHPRHMENQAHPQQVRQLPAESASKQLMHAVMDTSAVDQQALYGNYPTPVDNPFGLVSPNAGVNPGLLFSRPPSSGMPAPTSLAADSAVFGQVHHFPGSSAPEMSQNSPPEAALAMAPATVRKELRRTASAREIVPKRKAGGASASSPVKASTRPGLSRSASENRIPRLRGRASLPALAPALKPPVAVSAAPHGPSFSSPGTGLGITRSASIGGRPTGRSSPIRMQHQRQYQQQQHQQQQQQQQDQQHHRLSSLTSIPEVNTPQAQASVKFTIDASGRARVETMAFAEDEVAPPSTLRRNQSARTLPSKSKWDSSEEDDSSSTDDEPIIIPSRTTSFALPDPIKPTIGRGPLHLSQRSVSDRSTTSTFAGGSGDTAYNDPESEAETVMNELPKGAGDAASELEKLRQMRPKRSSIASGANNGHNGGAGGIVFGGASRGLTYGGSFGGRGGGRGGGRPLNLQAVSPTSLTADAGLPTPSSDSPSHGIRCICARTEAPPDSDGFIVQCESCELWLHGRCINITKRTLPSVYICAFCAQTPSVRRMHLPPASIGSSPLAHKSFQSFR